MSRVLVCGGRDFCNYTRVAIVMRDLNASLIITGGARGADELARRWAFANQIPYCSFPAQWDSWGRGAGPIRNGWMLEFGQPDLVVAFPGGRGTANMISQAEKAGVPVMRVDD